MRFVITKQKIDLMCYDKQLTFIRRIIMVRFKKSLVLVLGCAFLFLVFALPTSAVAASLIGDAIDGTCYVYDDLWSTGHNLFHAVDTWTLAIPSPSWSPKILRDHYSEQPNDVAVTDPGEEFATVTAMYGIFPPGGGWSIGLTRFLMVDFTADEVIIEEWYEFEESADWFEQSYTFGFDYLRFLDLNYQDDSGSTMPIIGLELIENTYANAPIASVIDNQTIQIIPQNGGTFNSSNNWEFMARFRILTGSDVIDTTMPTAIAGEPTPPGSLEVSFQDLESGLDEILLIGNPALRNADVLIPPFVQGTTSEVIVTVDRINHALASQVAFRCYDVAGNWRNIGTTIPAGEIPPPLPNTPASSPAGSPVEVTVDGATITFDNVEAGGDTTVTESDMGPPSPNFEVSCTPPVYYDITTTATYSGLIEICLTYDDTVCDESDLHLFHYEGGTWEDVTTSVDTVANIICGEVSDLSKFVLATPVVVGPIPPVADGSASPLGGTAPLTVTLTGTGTDADGVIVLYEWDFEGDGTYDWSSASTGDTAHTYSTPGQYDAVLRVTDDDGLTDTDDTETIDVSPPDQQGPVVVDELVNISVGRLAYDRRTGQFSVSVTVTNTSAEFIGSPVQLVVESISSPSVTVASPDGTTPDSKPYLDLTPLLGDDQLAPGESVATRIYFNNPTRTRFTFEPSVYGVILP